MRRAALFRLPERRAGSGACIRRERAAEIRSCDGGAVTGAAGAGRYEESERSIRSRGYSRNTAPARLGAGVAVEVREDAIPDPRVCARVAGHWLPLKLRSADEPLAARSRFRRERQRGSQTLPAREMKFNRPTRFHAPRLQSEEGPIRRSTYHPREGQPWNRCRTADVGRRDPTARKVEADGWHQERTPRPAGAPAHLGIAKRVHPKRWTSDVLGNRDRSRRGAGRPEQSHHEQCRCSARRAPAHFAHAHTRPLNCKNSVPSETATCLRLDVEETTAVSVGRFPLPAVC